MEIKLPFTPEIAERFDSLYQLLNRKYGIIQLKIKIEKRELFIYTVRNIDDLLDELIAAGVEDERVKDERLPYWAEIWPASLGLAKFILKKNIFFKNEEVLEIGCGLGISGMSAAILGGNVLLTDYQEDALRFSELNWMVNLNIVPATALMDWRFPNIQKQFDVILASDVVYEKRLFSPVCNTFEQLLKPAGRIYLSEPDRPISHNFFELLIEKKFSYKKENMSVYFREKATPLSIYEIRKENFEK
jgi:predicted nicotinamide N-methyase